ncbi:MAG: EamA family transporter RarD [Sphingomonas bacterium]|nr:EamA family transporter RarD [Sphingomonas bacterium]
MNPHPSPPAEHDSRWRAGLVYGIAAYALWGVMPIYFRQISSVASLDIVAHRIIWSLLVLAILLTVARAWDQVAAALRNCKVLLTLMVTSVLIATNWLLYVYAINNGHILAGSLGYYLNPLANILLGRFVLGESLTRRQWAAVGIAGAGVAVLAAGASGTLWISLILCFSFASYGLLRKIIAVDSLAGLSIETALLAPIALAWLLAGGATGRAMFDHPASVNAFLIAAGIVSTVPLLCFTAAARRLPYSTVGMLQFLAPTLQFGLAVGLYGEHFSAAHGIAFGAIWVALALYASSLLSERRASRSRVATELGEA